MPAAASCRGAASDCTGTVPATLTRVPAALAGFGLGFGQGRGGGFSASLPDSHAFMSQPHMDGLHVDGPVG